MASERVKSGKYWVYVWFFMGIIIPLAIIEWLANYWAGYHQIHLTDNLFYQILWAICFIGLLVGFIPKHIPKARKDSLYLGIYMLTWTGFMFCIHFAWVSFLAAMASMVGA